MKAKLLVASVLMSLSSAAFGWSAFAGMPFNGNGKWIKPTGETGSYTINSMVTIGAAVDGKQFYHVTSAYDIQTAAWQIPYAFKFDAATGFFDVFVGESDKMERVGSGYCIGNYVCHYSVTVQEYTIEQTFVLQDGKLSKMGSYLNSDHSRNVAWTEDFE